MCAPSTPLRLAVLSPQFTRAEVGEAYHAFRISVNPSTRSPSALGLRGSDSSESNGNLLLGTG